MNKKTKEALLLAPLLSPLMIMTAPVTAEPIQHSYNHTVQTSSAFYDSQPVFVSAQIPSTARRHLTTMVRQQIPTLIPIKVAQTANSQH